MIDKEKILSKYVPHFFGNSPAMYNELSTKGIIQDVEKAVLDPAHLRSLGYFSKEEILKIIDENLK